MPEGSFSSFNIAGEVLARETSFYLPSEAILILTSAGLLKESGLEFFFIKFPKKETLLWSSIQVQRDSFFSELIYFTIDGFSTRTYQVTKTGHQ
jgi:hypothetical protein